MSRQSVMLAWRDQAPPVDAPSPLQATPAAPFLSFARLRLVGGPAGPLLMFPEARTHRRIHRLR